MKWNSPSWRDDLSRRSDARPGRFFHLAPGRRRHDRCSKHRLRRRSYRRRSGVTLGAGDLVQKRAERRSQPRPNPAQHCLADTVLLAQVTEVGGGLPVLTERPGPLRLKRSSTAGPLPQRASWEGSHLTQDAATAGRCGKTLLMPAVRSSASGALSFRNWPPPPAHLFNGSGSETRFRRSGRKRCLPQYGRNNRVAIGSMETNAGRQLDRRGLQSRTSSIASPFLGNGESVSTGGSKALTGGPAPDTVPVV